MVAMGKLQKLNLRNIMSPAAITKTVVLAGVAGGVQAINDPYVTAIYTAANIVWNRVKPENQEVFMREFEGKKEEITEEVLTSEEFAQAFKFTAEAVSKTRYKEKIKIFARLLHSGATQGVLQDVDEYREFVRIVDGLSPKEIVILSIVDKGQNVPLMGMYIGPTANDTVEQRRELRQRQEQSMLSVASLDGKRTEMTAIAYQWQQTKEQLRKKFGPDEILNPMLNRLVRTGCITLHERTLDNSDFRVALSSIYFRLKEFIEKENGQII
jgi:hypothetical protein